MVQKVSTTFPDEPGTIENTSYNSETKTYTTTSESTYNSLVIPSNVTFNVEHDITVEGNLVVPNGSTINGNKKITVKETLVIEKKGTLVTSGENLVFNNLIVDGKMEVNGKFKTENNPLVTIKGELKINGIFGTIQEGEFTLKNGATLEVIGTFEDNRRATFTIEDGVIYIVNGNTLIKDLGGGLVKLLSNSSLENIPLGKMNFANIDEGTSSAEIDGARSLQNANLRNIDFRGVKVVDRTGLGGGRVNFSGVDLSHANLSNSQFGPVNFTNANLSGANLSGADLSTSILRGVDFTNVRINSNTNFGSTDFENAKTGPLDVVGMSEGDLTKVSNTLPDKYKIIGFTVDDIFVYSIIGPQVNASGLNLSGVNMTTNFTNLDGIILDNATLFGTNFSGISMKNASMKNANLSGADLSGVDMTTIDITGANMTDAKMNGTNITGRDLTNTILTGDLKGLITGNNTGTPILSSKHALIKGFIVGEGLDLSNMDLSGADLTNMSLKDCKLENTNLTGATLTNLKSGNIETATGLQLPSGYKFTYFTLDIRGKGSGGIVGPAVDLTNTHFFKPAASLFYDINLRDVNFAGTNLTGVIFENFDLRDADFTNAIFKNVTVKQSNLTNANLSQTTIIGLKTIGELGYLSPKLPSTYRRETINPDADRIFGPNVNLSDDDFKPPTGKQLDLSRINMNFSNFENSDFSGYALQLTNLTRSSFVQANLKNTTLHYINFNETDLTLVDFSGATIENTKFSYANISGADLSNVTSFKNIKSEGVIYDENTKFPPGCRVENGIFVGPNMDLIDADLRSANLSELSFEDSDLTGAIIQGANLSKADFRKVKSLSGVTTGLHPWDQSIGDSNGVEFPFDDPFSPLLPIRASFGSQGLTSLLVDKDGNPFDRQKEDYKGTSNSLGTYAFALGYIFGPNLILLGEDIAWNENRPGSLIRHDSKLTVKREGDQGLGEAKAAVVAAEREFKRLDAIRVSKYKQWKKAKDDLDELRKVVFPSSDQKDKMRKLEGDILPELKKILDAADDAVDAASAVLTKARETLNSKKNDERETVTARTTVLTNGTTGTAYAASMTAGRFRPPAWYNYVKNWIKRFRYLKGEKYPTNILDEEAAIFGRNYTNKNPFIIAGISLENTVFKVDDIYNVFFVCDIKNADLSQLGDAGIKESDLFVASLNVDTLILQEGYVVYDDRIFGPKMDLRDMTIDGNVIAGSLAGLDWTGSILDNMTLKNIDISRSNIHECDFSHVKMENIKALFMIGTPRKRDVNGHNVDYDNEKREGTLELGGIIDGSGLPSGVSLRESMLIGKGFDYSNETIYGDRNKMVNFKDLDFTDCNFNDSQLAFIDFTGATLTGCQFRNTRMRWITMRGSNVMSANLSDVIIRHSDLRKVNFQYSILRGGEFWDTVFDHDSVFNSADLQGSDFSYTTFNDRYNRGSSQWSAVSFAQFYDFASVELFNKSWQQKPNNNQINVANSYWIGGEFRSLRLEFDDIYVYDIANEDGVGINIREGQFSTIPRYRIDGYGMYPYGLLIGADAGLSFEEFKIMPPFIGSEYVGSFSLINIIFDPFEPYMPDGMNRVVPPYEGASGVSNRSRMNYLPNKRKKGKKEFLSAGAKVAFDQAWGGLEYHNHLYGMQCAQDCFHKPRNDHYHIIEKIPVPTFGSMLDKGERAFFHEYEFYDFYRSFSADERPRAYNRRPLDTPTQNIPFFTGYGNHPVQLGNAMNFPNRPNENVRARSWGD